MRRNMRVICIVVVIVGLSLTACSSKEVVEAPFAAATKRYENVSIAELEGIWPLTEGSESVQVSQALLGKKIPADFGENFSGYHGSFLLEDADKRQAYYVLDFTTEQNFFILLTEVTSQNDLVVLDLRLIKKLLGKTMISTSGKLDGHRIAHLLVIAPIDSTGETIRNPDVVFGFDISAGKIIDMQTQGIEIYLESGD